MMLEQLFKPSSELTFATVQLDCKRFLSLVKGSEQTVTIRFDLHEVTECDSAGLALIIEAKRLCKLYNKCLHIVGVPKVIYALAEFCGLKTILGNEEDVRQPIIMAKEEPALV